MSLLRTLMLGRENGIRSAIRSFIAGSGGEAPDWTPDSAYSAPSYEPPPVAPSAGDDARPEPPRDVTPPEGFEVVIHVEALRPGEVAEVIAGGTAICMANVDGTFYALANTCPPGDGPLGEGTLNGTKVTCPYHGWVFDVRDGSCDTNPSASVQSYDVQIKGVAVCVRL